MALELLTSAAAEDLDETQRAQVDLLRGQVSFALGVDTSTAPLLLSAGRRLLSVGSDMARETLLTAWFAAVAGEGLVDDSVMAEICSTAESLPERPGDPRPLDLLLRGVALLTTDGASAAAPVLQRAVA